MWHSAGFINVCCSFLICKWKTVLLLSLTMNTTWLSISLFRFCYWEAQSQVGSSALETALTLVVYILIIFFYLVFSYDFFIFPLALITYFFFSTLPWNEVFNYFLKSSLAQIGLKRINEYINNTRSFWNCSLRVISTRKYMLH